MYLADDFYLIAHQDTAGQSRLHPKSAGHGLAAALMAELVLMGNLTVEGNRVIVISPVPPRDQLAHAVLERLLREPSRRSVRDWLTILGRTAIEEVAKRLARAGVLHMVETKRLWGVNRSFVPVAVEQAAWPFARIRGRLTRREDMDLADQMLAGLCAATGLAREMLWDDMNNQGRAFLASVIDRMPTPLRTLVVETETAITRTATSPRP